MIVFMVFYKEKHTLFEELTGVDSQQVTRVLVVLHVISLTDGWVVSIAFVKVLFHLKPSIKCSIAFLWIVRLVLA